MTGPADAGPFPEGAVEALDRWRQGHVLGEAPIVVVGGKPVLKPFWASAAVAGHEVAGMAFLSEAAPVLRHAMVTAQGCELVKENFPVASVVPVYEASAILTDQQQATARAGLFWHLVHLTVDWAQDGFWVADLRIEYPVDKSVLVSVEPIEAFRDDLGYATLSKRLSAMRERAAVPLPTTVHVAQPLTDYLTDRMGEGKTPLDGVREIRLASNHHTSPTSVVLFVVADNVADVDQDEWTSAVDALQPGAAANGIALVGPDITTLSTMTAADYLTSHPIQASSS